MSSRPVVAAEIPRNRSATTAPSHVAETEPSRPGPGGGRGSARTSVGGERRVHRSAGDVAAPERDEAGGDRKGGVDGGEEERPLRGEVAGAAGGEGFELEAWKPALGGLPALRRDVLERAGPGYADADRDRHRPEQQRQGHAVERP